MSKPDFGNSKVQMAFVELAWPNVAPFAYGRYLKKGRGCVCFDVSGITTEQLDEGMKIDADCRFLTIDDETIPKEIRERIAKYDPEKEVFVVFNDGTGLSTFYGRVFDKPSPRELYETKQKTIIH